MKYVFFLLGCIALDVWADFLPQTQDIPMAPDIVLEGDYVSFDAEAGQILSFTGQVKTSCAAIGTFYANTLPSLGWIEEQAGAFTRGSDTLTLDCNDQTIHIDITLAN